MWSLPVSKSLFTFDKPNKRREKMKRRKGKRKIKILLF